MISGLLDGSEGLAITWDLHLPKSEVPAPLVIVVHGFKGFKDWGFFPELCQRLASAGFAALRINTSHNGVGFGTHQNEFTRLDVFARNRTSFEVEDVKTVLRAARTGDLCPDAAIDKDRIALLGHSRGAAAVLLAAAHDPNLRAVVTFASVKTVQFPETARKAFLEQGHWDFLNGRTKQTMSLNLTAFQDVDPLPSHLDLSQQVRHIKAPLLLIHGKEDTSVSCQSAIDLAKFSDGGAEVYLIDHANHVFGCKHPFAGSTPEFEKAVLKTIAHLESQFSS